jgi:phosphoribosyl-ATP pyrophosphohydrolase
MSIGDALNQLFADIEAKKNADPKLSYSASLIQSGPKKCAKKIGEEATELAMALIGDDNVEINNEAADLLYHFAAALIAKNIDPQEVANVLSARRGIGGHVEKASRKNG